MDRVHAIARVFCTLIVAAVCAALAPPSAGTASDVTRTTFAAPTASSTGPGDGLVAWYPFNGDANDASGNGNDGTVVGAMLTEDRFGQPSSAYRFDGTDDMILVSDHTTLDMTTALTLAAWVYPEATKSQTILRKSGAPTGPYNLGLSGTGYVVFALRFGGVRVSLVKFGYSLHDWTFLAATWDGSTMTLYENGTPVATRSQSGTLDQDNNPLLIGTRLQLPSSTFDGVLDEIMIWNRALSDDEVADLYQPPIAIDAESWGTVKARYYEE